MHRIQRHHEITVHVLTSILCNKLPVGWICNRRLLSARTDQTLPPWILPYRKGMLIIKIILWSRNTIFTEMIFCIRPSIPTQIDWSTSRHPSTLKLLISRTDRCGKTSSQLSCTWKIVDSIRRSMSRWVGWRKTTCCSSNETQKNRCSSHKNKSCLNKLRNWRKPPMKSKWSNFLARS